MTDGAKMLSDMSGIPREEIMSLWDQVKENHRKLRECKRHRFSGGKVSLGQKVICLECGGEMGLVSVGDYIRGYEAHGGNADDVWPHYHQGNRA